jgi:hypothetical protein
LDFALDEAFFDGLPQLAETATARRLRVPF